MRFGQGGLAAVQTAGSLREKIRPPVEALKINRTWAQQQQPQQRLRKAERPRSSLVHLTQLLTPQTPLKA